MKKSNLILKLLIIICCFCVCSGNGQQKDVYASESVQAVNDSQDLSLEVRTKIVHDKLPVYLFLYPQWQSSVISALSDETPVLVNMHDYLSEDGQRVILPLNTELLLYNCSPVVMNFPLDFDLDVKDSNVEIELVLNDEVIKKNINSDIEDKKCMIPLLPGLNMVAFNSKIYPSNYSIKKINGKIYIDAKAFSRPDFQIVPGLNQRDHKEDIEISQREKSSFVMEFSANAITALVGDLSIDLDEFPYLDILMDFPQKEETIALFYLAIDIGRDNVIDGYLQLGFPVGSFNVLDSVYEKWGKGICQEKGVVLKRIFVVIDNETDENMEEEENFFVVKNFSVKSRGSVFLLKEDFSLEKVFVSGGSHVLFNKNMTLKVVPEDIGDSADKYMQPVWVGVRIPYNNNSLKKFCGFNFKYEVEDIEAQSFNVYAIISDGNEIEKVLMFNSKLEKPQGTIRIDMSGFLPRSKILQEVFIDCVWFKKGKSDFPLSFNLSSLAFYERLPYPIKSQEYKQRYLAVLKEKNPEVIQVCGDKIQLNDFEGVDFIAEGDSVLSKRLSCSPGEYSFSRIDNEAITAEKILLSIEKNKKSSDSDDKPARISFEKISPVKYHVRIKDINESFFLVFSEGYNKQWRIFRSGANLSKNAGISVQEAKEPVEGPAAQNVFSLSDVRFLFQPSLAIPHVRINASLNGWYVDPEMLNGANEAEFVLFYLPQSFFCLGLIISIISGILGAGLFLFRLWRCRGE